MVLNNPLDAELLRLRVVLLGMLIALVFLGGALWRVQVLQAAEHSERLDRQSIRRVRLPGLRGEITDRHGETLAENRPSYAMAIYIEELRRPGKWEHTLDEIERVIREVSRAIGVAPTIKRDDLRMHIRKRLPLPFLAWRDLDAGALARWAESGKRFPGVDVSIEPVRVYPNATLAAHVIGYVGRARDDATGGTPYDYYLPDMTGKYGVEQRCNTRLTGHGGGRLIRVDASGFKYTERAEREPAAGEDLRLTLDANIQRLAEDALRGQVGAAVVVDPRNGDILALASAPTFDPNLLRQAAVFRELRNDPAHPLFNRALSGTYPPGSTFKPLVAIAALENGQVPASTTYSCPGYFELGGVRFRCWRRSGHGTIALRKAIEQSCNTYFCQLGLRCGYPRIYHMANASGFGYRTGVDLSHEAAGLLPNDTWKRNRLNDGWRSGDTCNVSIGQGALLVTPLQMVMFTAAMGNGGRLYRPRIVASPWDEGDLVQQLAWSASTLEQVRLGMEDVVEAPSGTGRRARIEGVRTAGKTGTAEYGPRDDRRKHAWMIAYAPADDPRAAIAIVIEDAVSGGVDAAPRVARVMAGIFGTTPVFVPAEPEVTL